MLFNPFLLKFMPKCSAGNTGLSGMPDLSRSCAQIKSLNREKRRKGEREKDEEKRKKGKKKKEAKRINQQQHAKSDCHSSTQGQCFYHSCNRRKLMLSW